MTHNPKYRADIDGLRALAVVAVVIFHAFPTYLSGGYVGVDVFFIISGYLISTILFDEMRQGSFSFADFYRRRVRRIFPALISVMAAVTLAGWVFLLPADNQRLSLQLLAASAAASNILFWIQTGYFDTDSETKVLLHLWSLGVEEQFYIFWPLILGLAYRCRLSFWMVCAIIFVVSLGLDLWLTIPGTSASFFSPFTRAWELAAGGLLASLRLQPHRKNVYVAVLANGASLLGLSLIVGAMLHFTKNDLYPGWRAMVPVTGTILVITAGSNTLMNRWLLGNRAVVSVGLISYPLYLWHLPPLVFSRLMLLPAAWNIYLVTASVAMACLTYWFIERPFRYGRFRAPSVTICCVALLLLVIVNDIGYATHGFAFRYPPVIAKLAATEVEWHQDWRVDTCFLLPAQPADIRPECLDKSHEQSVFIWGDSHAAALYPGMKALAAGHAIGISQYTASACAPIIHWKAEHRSNCKGVNDAALAAIQATKPTFVVLHADWLEGHYPLDDVAVTAAELKKIGIKHILLLGPVPQWKQSLPKMIAWYWTIHHQWPPVYMQYGLDSKIPPLDDRMRAIAAHAGIDYISAYHIMCHTDGCLTRFADAPDALTAFDYGHLSPAGSRYLVQQMSNYLLAP